MKRIISLALCFMLVFTLCPSVFAASNITWTGAAGDGSWHTDGNWDSGQVPGEGNTAIIPESKTAEITGNTTVTLDCSGEVSVASGGHLSLTGYSNLRGGKLYGDGDITMTDGSAFLWSGGSIEGSGAFTMEKDTKLVIETINDVGMSRPLENNGQVMLNTGDLVLIGGSGGTGTFTVSDGAYLYFEAGDYTIGGDFVNGGGMTIWNDSSVRFNAGYQQEDESTLSLKVWGLNNFNKLNITGTAELGGVLEVDLINDYIPQPGDIFEIMTCGSRTGEFSSIISNTDGITFEPTYTDTGLTLTVSDETATVWEVANATQLEAALNGFQSDDTIKLTAGFTYNKGIVIDGKKITFDLNSYVLDVNNSVDTGLKVKSGAVSINDGTGAFNVSGKLYGVHAIGSSTSVEVTSASATGTYSGTAAYASSGAHINVQGSLAGISLGAGAYEAGSKITVGGDCTSTDWSGYGAQATHGAEIIIDGNITATGRESYGVKVLGNSMITVRGNVQGGINGLYTSTSNQSPQVHIFGNCIATETGGNGVPYDNVFAGVYAEDGADISIYGNIQGTAYGIYTTDATTAPLSIYVGGDCISTETIGTGIYTKDSDMQITVDGQILSPGTYIQLKSGVKGINDFTTPTTKTGYRTYTDNADPPGIVWVKADPEIPTAPQNFTATSGDGQVALSWTAPESDGGAAISHYEVSSDNGGTWVTAATNTSHTFTGLTNGTAYTFKVRAVNSVGNGAEASVSATPTEYVCEIGAAKYATLDAALAAVTSGQTIKLLNNITHTSPIEVDGKTIYFELGNYDLLVDTSSNPDDSIYSIVTVKNGGKIRLAGTGTGKFNVKSSSSSHHYGIRVLDANSEVTVNNVDITGAGTIGVYMYGSGPSLDGGTITVNGHLNAGSMGVDVNAKNGNVVINGDITAGHSGVRTATNPGTSVTVNGNITVLLILKFKW